MRAGGAGRLWARNLAAFAGGGPAVCSGRAEGATLEVSVVSSSEGGGDAEPSVS